mgnify:CR=1 FL=1
MKNLELKPTEEKLLSQEDSEMIALDGNGGVERLFLSSKRLYYLRQ